MKRTAFLLISLYLGLVGANAQSNKYDLNEDGEVNVADVTLLVTKILDQNNGNEYDLNDDEDVNITDVILLVNYILNQNNNLICPDNHHPHMIDLGLPSGTKWACCNVGATKPRENGGYYAWGETEEKEVYDWASYSLCDGRANTSQILGDIAGTSYDVAHMTWGDAWQMPSLEQLEELKQYCSYNWTAMDGVYGAQFTGPNGGTIFMPAAGQRWKSKLQCDGSVGFYWTSTQLYYSVDDAYSLEFFESDTVENNNFRGVGYSVRPVMK